MDLKAMRAMLVDDRIGDRALYSGWLGQNPTRVVDITGNDILRLLDVADAAKIQVDSGRCVYGLLTAVEALK